MQLRYFTAVTRLNLLQQLRNPASILILTIVPLVIIPFMEPAFKAMLLQDGYTNVTGSEQAVPAMAVLFAFLAVQTIIQSFFHEKTWGMWPRLKMSAASKGALLGGKAFVAYLIQSVQAIAIIALGAVLFGFRPKGSLWALLLIILTFSAILAALGIALALWTPSEELALSLSSVIGMLAAGIGGSFCTVSSFPEWAQPISRFSPAYWALDAVHAVSLDGASIADLLPQVGMLAVFLIVIIGAIILNYMVRGFMSAQK